MSVLLFGISVCALALFGVWDMERRANRGDFDSVLWAPVIVYAGFFGPLLVVGGLYEMGLRG